MTAAELTDWTAYESVYGPLVVHERIDLAAALIGTLIARSVGAKQVQVKDLMPQWDQNRKRGLEDAWDMFEAMAKKAAVPSSRP